jgi:hypothetical protein
VGWGFKADCPNCYHHWEDMEVSLHIGGFPFGPSPDATHSLFCRRCYRRIYYPASMERKSWRRWYERFLRESLFQSAWVLSLLNRIDTSFEPEPWYVPRPVDLGEVACPWCRHPMVPGIDTGDRVTCPRCGSNLPVLIGYTFHAECAVDEDGFG